MYRSVIAFLLFLTMVSLAPAQTGGSSFVNSREHSGESLSVDLPEKDHIRNIGSYRDGLGMCVMSSIEMAALSLGMEEFRGLRNWCARESGGAGPEKVTRQIAAYCAAKKIPVPEYMQYQGGSPEKMLELCSRTGRMACITYGQSPRYVGPRNPRGEVAHMTCCPKFDGTFAVVLDNNFPGENSYEWMGLTELVRRVKYPDGQAWVFSWATPASPPAPKNRKDSK